MANATRRGAVATTPFGDYGARRPVVGTAQTYHPNALVGLNTAGYLDKLDDAGSKAFAGVSIEVATEVRSGSSDGDVSIIVNEPRFVVIAFSSITNADLGKTVYAADDQTGSLSGGSYANPIGTLHQVISATAGVVECAYGGKHANRKLGAARTMAATGNQAITRNDLNKTILVPNTAALTLTLPAVADTQAGDRLTVIKTNAGAFAVTLDGNSTETIDGATTLATIDANYDTAELVSTGTEWVVLARDIA